MVALMDLIARAMGWILRSLYEATSNYGVAIILFTVFIKLITIPLSLKQQRSMKETQELQPILERMQEKYKNNQEKLAEEMQKLYNEKKINPFGGCLLLIIQIPIIYSMFYAIAQPVKFMYPELLDVPGVSEAIEAYADKGTYKELYYIINERKDIINMEFFGLDLGMVPDAAVWMTWIIPLLSGLATFLSSYISKLQTKNNGANNEQTEAMQRYMMLVMPLLIVYISFKVPLGMGLYWFVNTVVSILLQLWMHRKIYGIGNKEMKLLDKGGQANGKNG